MRARTLIYVLFAVDVLLGVVLWIFLGGVAMGDDKMLASGFISEHPGLSFAILLLLLLIGVIQVLAVLSIHSRDSDDRDFESEKIFEKEARREIGFKVEPPAPQPKITEPPAPQPEIIKPPAPEPEITAPPVTVEGETPLSSLLTQLRLAGLDPQVEGDVQRGEQQGAAILRLAGNESALALTHIPTRAEWNGLFPRYDRIFIPLSETQWLSTERTETIVRREGDLA